MDIKTIIKKYKLNSFYISRTKKKKALFARGMDRVFLSVLTFIILNLLFIFKWNNLYISILLSFVFTACIYLILRIKEKNDIKKAKKITTEKIVEEIIYNDLINRSSEKFKEFFISLFKELGFNAEDDTKNEDFYIEVYKNDSKIGINLLQYSVDYSANENIIREFFIKLKKNNVNKGIIITTSNFNEETVNLANKLEKYKKIDLINIKDLICILKNTKLFPKEKEIESYILNKINIKTKTIREQIKDIISPDKWKKYLISGLSIWVFGQFTDFYIYYAIISTILFSLGIASFIRKVICYFYRNKKEDSKYLYDFIYKD